MDKLNRLTKIENEILRIVDDTAAKNKVLNIKELHKTAKKELSYSENKISKTIYKLVLNKLIIPGKKITINSVLTNDKRNNIYTYIKNNPGAHLREIRDNLDSNPQITNWHLKVLENFEFIRRRKYTKYRVFFSQNSCSSPLFAHEIIFLLL